MQIIVVSFPYHIRLKKSNSSSCFKDKNQRTAQRSKHFIGNIAERLEDNALENNRLLFI